MAYIDSTGPARPLHPLHSILLAFVFPLFLGTLVSDIAYWRSYHIQWSNFAQWLNAGGLAAGGLALLCALVHVIRRRRHDGRALPYFLFLLAAWITGLLNAFAHSQDAWAIMPEALWWSGISALLALIASWLGFSGTHAVERY